MTHLLPKSKSVTNADFARALALIRLEREQLKLPELCYGAVTLTDTTFSILAAGQSYSSPKSKTPIADLYTWINEFHTKSVYKIVSLYVEDKRKDIQEPKLEDICSTLWLDLDIVPLQTLNAAGISTLDIPTPDTIATETLLDLAAQVSTFFDKNGIVDLEITTQNEVIPSFLYTLDDYQQISNSQGDTVPTDWEELFRLAQQYQDKKMVFVSATPRGGGVALMRHALIRLYRLLGVDAHWHVLTEHADVFQITKGKFHNVLQAVSDPTIHLTDQDKKLYEHWSKENAQILMPALEDANTIIIDDPQPAGLIPYIKKHNATATILYRSHIQIESALLEDQTSPQSITWNYLWQWIKHADVFIAHPVASFVPAVVPKDILVSMPPTTDSLDGLNKALTPEQTHYYMDLFNQILLQSYQTPLDLDRPYFIQIARFDPSKGIPDVIESYRLFRESLKKSNPSDVEIPQLVIVGHGSIDDPDGMPVLHLTQHMLTLPLYREYAQDIKVARVHHSDQLLNALMRQSYLALQLSHKEGFEIKVTEALLKGKPVVSYRAGGIPLQIQHETTGFIVDTVGDTQAVAKHLHTLVSDKELYKKIASQAKKHARRDVLTIPNARRWLQLALGMTVSG